ncbi:MAG: hypothetical protein WC543_03400 [Candidatus Omnitrophota bacterium]
MRDLLYKNLTLCDRGRKIITSAEVADKEGVHSIVRRHFTYFIKPIESDSQEKPTPYLYVLKERNTKEKREHFFCKIKGSLVAKSNGKLLNISFIHTLSVELTASQNQVQNIE